MEWLLYVTLALAAPAPADLDGLIALAEERNPELAGARRQIAIAEAARGTAGLWPEPRLEVGVALVPVETRVGPQRGRLSLAQPLPSRGVRAADVSVAEARLEHRRAALERLRRRLAAEVAGRYYELALLERTIEVTRENRDLMTLAEQVVRKRYETGGATYAELIRAQVEIGTLEEQLRSLERRRRPARAALNALLHREPDAPLPAAVVPEMLWPVPTAEALTARLSAASPDLQTIEAEAGIADARLERTLLDRRPDWSVSLSWIPTGSAVMPGTVDSGRDPLSIGVGLRLPLGRERYRAAERVAELERELISDRRASIHDRLTQQVEERLFEIADAEGKINLYRSTLLPKARQALDASRTGVRTGTTGVTELIEAQQVWLRFRLDYETALCSRGRARAELEALVGGFDG